jgi:hypothetical protein
MRDILVRETAWTGRQTGHDDQSVARDGPADDEHEPARQVRPLADGGPSKGPRPPAIQRPDDLQERRLWTRNDLRRGAEQTDVPVSQDVDEADTQRAALSHAQLRRRLAAKDTAG